MGEAVGSPLGNAVGLDESIVNVDDGEVDTNNISQNSTERQRPENPNHPENQSNHSIDAPSPIFSPITHDPLSSPRQLTYTPASPSPSPPSASPPSSPLHSL